MALTGWTHAGNYRLLTRATTSNVWSFLVWVYPTGTTSYMTPLQSRDSGYVTIVNSGGASVWTADYDGSGTNFNRNTGLTIQTNAWQMVVATVDATTGTNSYVVYKGYAGSVSSDTWTHVSGVTSRSITNWRQYDSASSGRQFQGRIALAAVWDTVLSSTDVDDLYNGGAGVDPATIQSGNIRLSNYFDDTQLGINGDTNGGTYTDNGTLTTVDGPFAAAGGKPWNYYAQLG